MIPHGHSDVELWVWWVLLCYFVLSRLAFTALALVWDHCHPEKQSCCHSDAINWYLMDLFCINNYRSFVMSSSTRLKYRPKPWQSFYRVLQMAVACWWLSCLFPSCILKLIWSKTSHFCSSQIRNFCHRFSFQFLCNFDCFISFFMNVFLTAILLLRPFLKRLQQTVDESTERPNASVRIWHDFKYCLSALNRILGLQKILTCWCLPKKQ